MSHMKPRLRRLAWLGLSRLPRRLEPLVGHRVLTVEGSPSEPAKSHSVVFGESRAVLGRNVGTSAIDNGQPESVIFPPVRVWRFDGAEVVHNSRFNAVVVGDKLVLPERREPGPWAIYKGRRPRRVGLVHGQSRELVLLKRVRPVRRLPEAAFVGTRAPYNWYHWIANILPALHVANEGNIPLHVPLILPDEINNFPQMIESLSIFLDAREIVWISQDQVLQVDDLYWADSPVYDSPFSRDESKRLPLTVHAEAMVGYRKKILDYCASRREPPSSIEKVFLARSPGTARPYNSAEVEGWAQELGFTLCFTDKLTFPEQIDLFLRATHIVGPTGAAWSGIMFAQPRLRGLRLHGGAAPYENYFSNLATISGATIYDLAGEKVNAAEGEDRFHVSRDSFFEAIRTLLMNQ